MKIFIDLPINDEEKNQLTQLGYKIQKEIDDFTNVLVSGDGKLLNNINHLNDLKFIQLISAGFDYFDLESVLNRGILVSNARGVYSHSIAEFVVSRLLEVNQELRSLNKDQFDVNWNKKINLKSLKNQKGAILGTGSIAQEVARLLNAFNPLLDGYNTKGTKIPGFDDCYPLTQFDANASEYDFVIITLPLNAETKHFMNHERLLNLNQDCVLINIARGPIIDEKALTSILEFHLKAVILDVFEQEPLIENSALWLHPKAYLSPHISFKNNYYKSQLKELIINNLINFANNQPLTNELKKK